MYAFGWSIDYVLGLTFPVFIGLYELTHTARLDAAVDCMYIPYAAAKYGKKCADALFKECGGVFVDKKTDTPSAYTDDDMLAAQARMDAIIQKRKECGGGL